MNYVHFCVLTSRYKSNLIYLISCSRFNSPSGPSSSLNKLLLTCDYSQSNPEINHCACACDIAAYRASFHPAFTPVTAILSSWDFESLAHWIKETHVSLGTQDSIFGTWEQKLAQALSRLMLIRLGFTLDFDEPFTPLLSPPPPSSGLSVPRYLGDV